MNLKKFTKNFFIISEYLVGLACLVYMCFLSYGSISTFQLKQTAQSLDLSYYDKVPSVTICDSKGYKFYVNDKEDFNDALLTEGDIGPVETNRTNRKNWDVDSFFSPILGRCYTYHRIGNDKFPTLIVHRNNSFQVSILLFKNQHLKKKKIVKIS